MQKQNKQKKNNHTFEKKELLSFSSIYCSDNQTNSV